MAPRSFADIAAKRACSLATTRSIAVTFTFKVRSPASSSLCRLVQARIFCADHSVHDSPHLHQARIGSDHHHLWIGELLNYPLLRFDHVAILHKCLDYFFMNGI